MGQIDEMNVNPLVHLTMILACIDSGLNDG